MKKILVFIVCTTLIVGLFSCENEPTLIEDSNLYNLENDVLGNDLDDIEFRKTIVIVRCDLHRNKYDCEAGRGLCNCEWFPDFKQIPTDEKVEVLLDERNGNAYLFNENFDKFSDNSNQADTFYIDEAVSFSYGTKTITFDSGEYRLIEHNGRPAVLLPVSTK